MNEWDIVNKQGSSQTARLKVFEGWIVEYSSIYQGNYHSSITFVPDKNHEWKLEDSAL